MKKPLGIGVWGLGVGGLGFGPNPQPQIPNPHFVSIDNLIKNKKIYF